MKRINYISFFVLIILFTPNNPYAENLNEPIQVYEETVVDINYFNEQFSAINTTSVVGYNKIKSQVEVLNLGGLLSKIRKDLQNPVDQEFLRVSSKFGIRRNPFNYSTELVGMGEGSLKNSNFHTGLDISDTNINGTNIYSMLDGTVKKITKSNSGYGNLVIIDHGGFETLYAHMSVIRKDLNEGGFVLAGENIGQVGSTGRSTGPHLHIEFNFNNISVNPELFLLSNNIVYKNYYNSK